ncbi:Glycerol kinase [compost metagenome]
MQMQADYLGVAVVRPANLETTALGAAFMAGLGAGVWKDLKELRKIAKVDREFKVKMTPKDRKARQVRWELALEKV